MGKELPDKFLEWAYFERIRFVKSFIEPEAMDESKFLIESTRHNPYTPLGTDLYYSQQKHSRLTLQAVS